MKFERQIVETLTDDNGNEIKMGDMVVYTTKTKPQSVLAQFVRIEKGYMTFLPVGSDTYYTVQPKTINTLFKANTKDLFVLD